MNRDSFTFRLAKPEDGDQIAAINRFWIDLGRATEMQRNHGYLHGEPYDADILRDLIERRLVSVAVRCDEIAGYYLVDDGSANPETQGNILVLERLARQGLVDLVRIAPRAQAAIAQKFIGLGLYRLMSAVLHERICHRFDALYSTILKDNVTRDASLHVGWTIIGEDDTRYLVLNRIAPALPR